MDALAQLVSTTAMAGHIFSERQLGDLLGGGDGRRYGLVNRALKDGSLVRVKRGTYLLGPRYRTAPVHPFAVAQSLVAGSYISLESALAHHGWIPEAVFTTASVSPGRKTHSFETDEFGAFTFHPIATASYQFLTSIDRTTFGRIVALIAQPLRAIMDLVALRKVKWSGIDWLTTGMRVDEQALFSLRRKDFAALKPVYKHKAVVEFLDALEDSVIATTPHRQNLP